MIIKNISLVGFMGSGKTTIGKILAEKTGFFFADTDKIIEYIAGKKISYIFKEDGEPFFRNLESSVIENLYKNNKNCLFACGGGVFQDSKNIDIIRKNSLVVFLDIDAEEAYERLKNSKKRPLLDTKEDVRLKIERLIKGRYRNYLVNSDIRIKVGKQKPEFFAEKLLKMIFDKNSIKTWKLKRNDNNQNRCQNI